MDDLIWIPNLEGLKTGGLHVQLFSLSSTVLRSEFQQCRNRGMDTASELIIKQLMYQLKLNDAGMNFDVRELLHIVEDTTFTMVNESTCFMNRQARLRSRDIKANEKRIKAILRPRELFDKDFMNRISAESKKIKQLIDEMTRASELLQQRNKIYLDLKEILRSQYKDLANLKSEVNSANAESVIQLEKKIQDSETMINVTHEVLKISVKEAADKRKEIKQLEAKLKEDVKAVVTPKIDNGLNDLLVILQDFLPKTSARRLFDTVYPKKSNKIVDSILDTMTEKLPLAHITPPDLDDAEEVDLSDIELELEDSRPNISYKKHWINDVPDNISRTVTEKNVYVTVNTEIVPGHGGTNNRGKKIKQKLHHAETNLGFGWRRKHWWSFSKTWGFFPSGTVNVVE